MTEEKQELKEDLRAPEGTEELKTTDVVENPIAPEDKEESELEKVKKERDNYKEGLLVTKDKLKAAKLAINDEPEPDTDDVLNSALDEISDNEEEKALIRSNYGRLAKSGTSKEDVANDLEDAKLLANKPQVIKENKEIRTALLAKQSVSNSGAGSSVKKEHIPEPKLNPIEQSVMNRTNASRVSRGEEPLTARDFLGN